MQFIKLGVIGVLRTPITPNLMNHGILTNQADRVKTWGRQAFL